MSDIVDISKNVPENVRSLLRWWYQQQAQLRIEEADSIRNGVLQDVFALRRRLELLCQDDREPSACEPCLENVQRIYEALEALSDRISSPYVEDSLPLAIRHCLQPWRSLLPLQVALQATWDPEPAEQVALLLTFLNRVLQAVASGEKPPARCQVSLQMRQENKALLLQVGYAQPLPQALIALSHSADMTALLQTFHLLSEGCARLDVEPQAMTWELTW